MINDTFTCTKKEEVLVYDSEEHHFLLEFQGNTIHQGNDQAEKYRSYLLIGMGLDHAQNYAVGQSYQLDLIPCRI